MRILFFLLTVFAVTLYGQTASVTGRVTDQSGAVVPDAQVQVRSVETGTEFRTTTNEEGYYNVPSLQPGRYGIVISKTGFMTLDPTSSCKNLMGSYVFRYFVLLK